MRTLVFALFVCTINSFAVIEQYDFNSAADANRFNNLVKILRCPTCPNQSIHDSNSLMSENIGAEVAELINSGFSDEEILDKLVDRYQDFILYKPRYKGAGVVLWIFPLIVLIFSLCLLFYRLRKFIFKKNSTIDSE